MEYRMRKSHDELKNIDSWTQKDLKIKKYPST